MRVAENNVYHEHGYMDREDYLRCLADDYDIDYEDIKALADMLGENEDFDALVTSLQDAQEWFGQ